MSEWLHSLLPQLPHYGFVVVFVALFLNNVGLPLPGETVLLGAGFILGRDVGFFSEPVFVAMLAATLAGFLGGACAFAVGRRVDRQALSKVRWLRAVSRRLDRAERLYSRHGALTVCVGRFIPVLPPVAVNLLAGVMRVPWPGFLWFSLVGSAGFSCLYMMLGFLLGAQWLIVRAFFRTLSA